MAKRRTGGVAVLDEQIADLVEQRDRIVELQGTVDAAQSEMISIISGKPARTGRPSKGRPPLKVKRASNDMTAGLAMARVLVRAKNEPMVIADLTAATLKSGWKTKSKDPSAVLYQTLRIDPEFKVAGKKGSKHISLKPAAYKRYRKEFSA